MTITLNADTGITTPPVSVLGNTSGSITFAAPDVAGTNTQTLVAATGTLAPIVSGTAVASTSGTSIDFTSIPSWVKRITVMLNGVSTSGTSNLLIQIGSSSFSTSGYTSAASREANNIGSTAGFIQAFNTAAAALTIGQFTLNLQTGNSWVGTGLNMRSDFNALNYCAGSIALSGTLDRVRITTVNGTDTFDAGTINILYE